MTPFSFSAERKQQEVASAQTSQIPKATSPSTDNPHTPAQVSKATDEPTSASKPMKHDNTEATIKATETAAEKEGMTTRLDVTTNVVHHQQVEPVVAHAQAHDFSHNQAVSSFFAFFKFKLGLVVIRGTKVSS